MPTKTRSAGGAVGPALPPTSDSDADVALAPGKGASPKPGRMRLLVSACLLGENVRYDGQHKRDPFLTDTLGRWVEWVRVCPEVDCGMPIPRPSMHLVGDPSRPRLVASKTGADLTSMMERFISRRLDELEGQELCGYVCKKDSPSSGMERVKVYDGTGAARRVGSGLFTKAFMERFPELPVEEEGRLHDPGLREAFIERIFAVRRWRDLVKAGRSRGRLVDFHADHKYLLLAHGRQRYAELGRLVARAKDLPTPELYEAYRKLFNAALAQRATPGRVADVLTHMAGFFKRELSADEKAELVETVRHYHDGLVPLVVPLTLIKHYVRKYRVAYLERQAFLSPYPEELMLRNHV